MKLHLPSKIAKLQHNSLKTRAHIDKKRSKYTPILLKPARLPSKMPKKQQKTKKGTTKPTEDTQKHLTTARVCAQNQPRNKKPSTTKL